MGIKAEVERLCNLERSEFCIRAPGRVAQTPSEHGMTENQ